MSMCEGGRGGVALHKTRGAGGDNMVSKERSV